MTEELLSDYTGKLDKGFRFNKKKPLGEYLFKSKRGSIIPAGTLVLMPSTLTASLKILDFDTPNKGFSIPFIISEEGMMLGISPHYLLWYFRIDFVERYLVSQGRGSVMPRIPWETIYNLRIPLPIHVIDSGANPELSGHVFSNSSFRKLIVSFFEDYRLNYEKQRFNTAFILAGAISEAILYKLMVNSNLDLKALEDDNSLTLGKLIHYAKLLKINEKLIHFPLNHFQDVLKQRNRTIHTGAAIKRTDEYFVKSDLACFDNIIKYFGI